MNLNPQKILLAILMAIALNACNNEAADHPENNQPPDPLTISAARNWYNENFGTSITLRSSDNEPDAQLIPDWSLAELSSDTLWYVVESETSFSNDMQMRMIMSEADDNWKSEEEQLKADQIIRLIVMQNKQTGEKYSFIMAVIPETGKEESNELRTTKYFSRDSNLTGLIMFFNINGTFINGWHYKNGTPMYKVSENVDNEEDGELQLRSFNAVKYYMQTVWFQSVDGGDLTYMGTTYREYTDYIYEQDNWRIPGVDLRGIDSGGGGGGIVPPSQRTKQPQKRTDCPPKAAKNAQKSEAVMTGSQTIIDNVKKLKANAQNTYVEYGMVINKNSSGKYIVYNTGSGSAQETTFQGKFNIETVLTTHTHPNSKDPAAVTNFTGPSGSDIHSVLYSNAFINRTSDSYMGQIIYAYDGSQYLIYVDDVEKAKRYINKYANAFDNYASAAGSFYDKNLKDDYLDVVLNLKQDGYSTQDSHDYAMTYLLDKYNTGIKLSKKSPTISIFKEMKTEVNLSNNSFQPKICP